MTEPVNANITQYFNDPCCRDSYAKFGMKGHNGIDYGVPVGTPVKSSITGTVYTGYEDKGYGYFVFITDKSGNQTVYGHLSKVFVHSGQAVNQGTIIAESGNTGNSTGPHLHFGYRPVGYNKDNGFLGYIDPLPLLGGNVVTISETEYNNLKADSAWKNVGQPLSFTKAYEAMGGTPGNPDANSASVGKIISNIELFADFVKNSPAWTGSKGDLSDLEVVRKGSTPSAVVLSPGLYQVK